jgi:hypothetical protein
VLDRSHRVAAVFLRDLLAEDLQPVVVRVAREKDLEQDLEKGSEKYTAVQTQPAPQ